MHKCSQDHVFFDGLLDIWYFSWHTPDTWLAPPHRSRSANFPCCQTLSPNWYSPSPLSFFCAEYRCEAAIENDWQKAKLRRLSVNIQPESRFISVRSLALSPARPITSSSLPPLLLSLLAPRPCPFSADKIKSRGGDRSIGLDDLSVTRAKLVCSCTSSVLRSAKVGLFFKLDPDFPLHSLFLYLSFARASLRGREQTDTLHHSE